MRAAAVLATVLACACTQDFDAFRVMQGADESDASGGTGTGGSAGTGTGGSAGTGDASAGSGGSADSSAGAAGVDAGADAAPDIVCPTGEKACAGGCVSTGDPLTGCASTSCA